MRSCLVAMRTHGASCAACHASTSLGAAMDAGHQPAPASTNRRMRKWKASTAAMTATPSMKA
eukprot:9115089-Alexandrium_andersonii.AAC.1